EFAGNPRESQPCGKHALSAEQSQSRIGQSQRIRNADDNHLKTGQTASQSGKFKRSDLTSLGLPIDSTGGWNLSITLTPSGNSYTGTRTVELSIGATADFNVTGTYNSGSDTSKVALVGAAGKLGLVISTSGAILNVESATG